MEVCRRCRRHVLGRACPFCGAAAALVAGAVAAVACGGQVRAPLDASVEDSSTADASTEAPDASFEIPDTSVGSDDGWRPGPVYGAPPIPDL